MAVIVLWTGEETPQNYIRGEVVAVLPDSKYVGTKVSWEHCKDVEADIEELSPNFTTLRLPNIPEVETSFLLTEGATKRRTHKILLDSMNIERRGESIYEEGHKWAGERRDTYSVNRFILRDDLSLEDLVIVEHDTPWDGN